MQTQEAPRYRLLQPFYCAADFLIPEDEVIEYHGTPNEAMEPLNDAAKQKMRAHLDHLDALAAKAGKKRTGDLADHVFDAVASRPREEVRFPHRDASVPVMGAKKTAVEAPRVVEKPADNRYKQPKKQMGTIIHEVPNSGVPDAG